MYRIDNQVPAYCVPAGDSAVDLTGEPADAARGHRTADRARIVRAVDGEFLVCQRGGLRVKCEPDSMKKSGDRVFN
jgi:hypothetical protein